MSINIEHIQHSNRGRVPKKTELNLQPSNIKSLFSAKRISDKKKAQLYKDLSTLITAGVDFRTALTIIRDQQPNQYLKTLLNDLLDKVVSGRPLYESMEISEKFTPYEIFSIKIGEETRKLETILSELEKYFQRKVKLKKQIISILTYPAFILILTLGVLYFMLRYVVPLFQSIFNQFDKDLPPLTSMIIDLSQNFNTILLWFAIGALIIFLIYKRIKGTTIFRKHSANFLLRIPFVSKLIKQIYLTRFCQSMALLLVSKTSLIEALSLVQKMIGFYPIEQAISTLGEDIKRGGSLGSSLAKFKVFDANLISMVQIAEKVNELDDMFLNLATQYDQEVEHKTKIMGTVIEPLLILFIGSIVGVIMISMYAPMFDLSKVIGA